MKKKELEKIEPIMEGGVTPMTTVTMLTGH